MVLIPYVSIVTPVAFNLSLWTYASNRDLGVLYFDGMSAKLDDSSILVSQEEFLARKGGIVVGKRQNDSPSMSV